MRAKFKCPGCGELNTIDTQTVGDAVTCAACGKVTKVNRPAKSKSEKDPGSPDSARNSTVSETSASGTPAKPVSSKKNPSLKPKDADDYEEFGPVETDSEREESFDGEDIDSEDLFGSSDENSSFSDGDEEVAEYPSLARKNKKSKKDKKDKKEKKTQPESPAKVAGSPFERLLSDRRAIIGVSSGAAVILLIGIYWIFSGPGKPVEQKLANIPAQVTESPPAEVSTPAVAPVELTAPVKAPVKTEVTQRPSGKRGARITPPVISFPDWSPESIDLEPLAVKYGRPLDEWIAIAQPNLMADSDGGATPSLQPRAVGGIGKAAPRSMQKPGKSLKTPKQPDNGGEKSNAGLQPIKRPVQRGRMTNEEFQTLVRAINALGVYRSKADQVLIVLVPHLLNSDERIRAVSRDAIFWLNPQPKQLLPHLSPILDPSNTTGTPVEVFEVAKLLREEGAPFRQVYIDQMGMRPSANYSDCIGALAAIGPSVAAPLLDACQAENRERLKIALLKAIGQVSPPANSAIEKLVPIASDAKEDAVRAAAFGAIAAIAPADPRLHKLLEDAIQKKQWTAVDAAFSALTRPEPSLQKMILEIPADRLHRPALATMLQANFTPDNMRVLITWLFKHPTSTQGTGDGRFSSPLASQIGPNLIQEMGDAAIPGLVELLKDPDKAIRDGALMGLKQIQSPNAAFALIDFASQATEYHAIEGNLWMASRSGEASREVLSRFIPGPKRLNVSSERIPTELEFGMDRTMAEAVLKSISESPDPFNQANTAFQLLQCAGPQAEFAIPELMNYLTKYSDSPPGALYITLTNIGPGVVPELLKKLDTSDKLTSFCLGCFGRMGEEAGPAIPEIVKRLEAWDKKFGETVKGKNAFPDQAEWLLRSLSNILRDQRADSLPEGLSPELKMELARRIALWRVAWHQGGTGAEFRRAFQLTAPIASEEMCKGFFEQVRGENWNQQRIQIVPSRLSDDHRNSLRFMLASPNREYQLHAACLSFCAGDDQPDTRQIILSCTSGDIKDKRFMNFVVHWLQAYQTGFGKPSQDRVAELLKEFCAKAEQSGAVIFKQTGLTVVPSKNDVPSRFNENELTIAGLADGSTIPALASVKACVHPGLRVLLYGLNVPSVQKEVCTINLVDPELFGPANWEVVPFVFRCLEKEKEFLTSPEVNRIGSAGPHYCDHLATSLILWQVTKDPRAQERLAYLSLRDLRVSVQFNPDLKIDNLLYGLTLMEAVQTREEILDYFWNSLLTRGHPKVLTQAAIHLWRIKPGAESARRIARNMGFDQPMSWLSREFTTTSANLWDLMIEMGDDAEAFRPGLESLTNHPSVRMRSEARRVLKGLKPSPAAK
ncbi:MAG: hypothetical protein JWM11_2744 [Planctomycetaceae bacterium]|nr:hypothetical protein [Planctomycetaceae bacterium]